MKLKSCQTTATLKIKNLIEPLQSRFIHFDASTGEKA